MLKINLPNPFVYWLFIIFNILLFVILYENFKNNIK